MKSTIPVIALSLILCCGLVAPAQQKPENHGPLDVVQAYLAAALEGRAEDAARLAKPGSSPASRKQVEEIPLLLKNKTVIIRSVFVSDSQGEALAISEPVQLAEANPDGRDTGCLTFLLDRSDGKWRVSDIDFGSETDANQDLAEFRERVPPGSQIEIMPTVAAAAASGRDPRPASPAPLEFCILPNPPETKRTPMLDASEFESLQTALQEWNAFTAVVPGGRFRWVEVASAVEDLPFSVTREGRKYAVVSADPSRVLQWRPTWSIREVMAGPGAGSRSLEIEMDVWGATAMRELTRSNLKNRLAIIVDGKIVSIPIIQGEIGGKALITGDFSDEEWKRLQEVLTGASRTAVPPPSNTDPLHAQGPGEASEIIKVFQLRFVSAEATATLLSRLYGGGDFQAAADVRTNSLIVRGQPDRLAEVEALLLRLDVRSNDRDLPSFQEPPRTTAASDTSPSALAELRQEYVEFEQKAGALAEAIRQLHASSGPQHPQVQSKRSELRQAVERAFAARQQLQRAETAQMLEQLQRIERKIALREEAKEEIIERRVEELLNPSLQWIPEDSQGTAATPEPSLDSP